MTQTSHNRHLSSWPHNALAATIWLTVITSGVITIIQDANRDSPHYPTGFASPVGTAILLTVLVATVLFTRRVGALLTSMTAEQRDRLDPWRADRIAAAGFTFIFTAAFIGQITLGTGFAFGENIIVAVLISIICVQPLIEIVQRNRLVYRCASENAGGWVARTRIGAFTARCSKRLRHWCDTISRSRA